MKEPTVFKFREPASLGVFSTKGFVEGLLPVLRVVHEHDGYWQFLTAEFMNVTTEEELARAEEGAVLLCLRDVVALDDTLNALFDLPCGEFADRKFIGDEWVRSAYDEEDESTR
ncbi:hypothetical protein HF324_10090 [Chitinophaga oryzae]|uniref:Uncharacterized protein n=1 Tax=Chitinophaga oryzae TaxID=2725414 RepID=A0AAE6ZFG0_9BACT|nr:hypothetical protein [Chitinophaga oryzae]QJB31706.1 hypothetical protein HF329_10425 [Chitinophaga oryzae]QJB38190.1 hypothetical protein HF324_10090 [Chitinophaga oryzae]